MEPGPAAIFTIAIRARLRGALRNCRDSRIAAALLLLAAFGSVAVVFWPGLISWDTSQILRQAAHGPVIDWWTGLGTLMLRAWLDLGIGVGPLWAALVAATIVGLYGCLRLRLTRLSAAAGALLITVFPPVYAALAAFSRDNAYMCFTILALAALSKRAASPSARHRNWLAVALACAVMATICRQNGLIDVAVVATWGGLSGRRLNLRRVTGTVAVALVAAVGVYVSIGLAQRAAGVITTYATRGTMVYDLAAMSVDSGHDYFPRDALRALGPGTASPTITSLPWLRAHFVPLAETTLSGPASMEIDNGGLAAREYSILKQAWLSAVTAHPVLYLRVRAELSEYMLGLTQSGLPAAGGLLDFQGLSNPSNFGHPLAFPGIYRAASAWLGTFLGPEAEQPLDRGWVYLALLIVLGGFLLTRISRYRAPAAAFLLLALGNQAVIFFAAPAASFRYILILPPLALMSAAFAARSAMSGAPSRRAPRAQQAFLLPRYRGTA